MKIRTVVFIGMAFTLGIMLSSCATTKEVREAKSMAEAAMKTAQDALKKAKPLLLQQR